VVCINEDRQEEAVDELIRTGVQIIKDGIERRNIEDFRKEFLAYWNDQGETRYLSQWTPSSEMQIVKVTKIVSTPAFYPYLVSRDIAEAEDWLAPLKMQIDKGHTYDALHIPLSNSLDLPLPQSNGDIYGIVKRAGGVIPKALERFLNADESNRTILSSFRSTEDRILFGWIFDPWEKGIYNGFRPDRLPLEIRLQRTSLSKIRKIRIERADSGRIFNRGGLGISDSLISGSVAILGCGSLGSQLAVALSKSGISDFLLVDKEELEPANVGRHICGLNDAIRHLPKSQTVKDYLLAQLPNIRCQAIQEDILSYLEREESALNRYSLIIVAVGDMAIERRLSYLLLNRTISAPLAFIWMEPFGVAGEFLFMRPGGDGCFQCCFDEKGIFRFSVAKPDSRYLRRESGCQSTFMPYSYLAASEFINVVARRILRCFDESPKENFLLTWLGDVTRFKAMGYRINDEWVANEDYSTYERRLRRYETCDKCGK
jgi:molybdopterin/thiamine biosynthesis adenylyltransferase